MPEVMSIEVDEEFDPRPPSTPFGLRGPEGNLNYGLIGGIAIAIVLVLMLIFVVVKPFGGEKAAAPVSTWKPKDPTKNLEYLESYPATSPMASSVKNSLEAWADYYTSGDLSILSSNFDLTGNQYAQLVAGNAKVLASPEPGPPAKIRLGPIGKVQRRGDIFTVRVIVNWTKPGAAEETFYKWDIDMKAEETSYVLSTVRPTSEQDKQPIDFCGAIKIVAGLDTLETISKEIKKFPAADQVKKAGEAFNIKIAAWKYLEVAVSGTDSEDDVVPILMEYEALSLASTKAANIEEMFKENGQADISVNRKNISDRAEQECEADIVGK